MYLIPANPTTQRCIKVRFKSTSHSYVCCVDAPIVLQTHPGIVVETTSDDPDCKNSSLNDHMDVRGSTPAPGLYSVSTYWASRDVFTCLLPVFITCV